MKPTITCFMMTSVDGRVRLQNWHLRGGGAIYERHAAKIRSDGWIVGRTTAEEFTSSRSRKPRSGRFTVPPGDYVAPHRAKTFAILLDPKGKLVFDTNHIDTEHIITVVTSQVPDEHLAYLREKQVSYIVGGKRFIDLLRVAEKLGNLFPIKRLTLQGGGGANGSFLAAGLVNEIQILVVPVADGEAGRPTLFDIATSKSGRRANKLELLSARRVDGDYLLLRYRVLDDKKRTIS